MERYAGCFHFSKVSKDMQGVPFRNNKVNSNLWCNRKYCQNKNILARLFILANVSNIFLQFQFCILGYSCLMNARSSNMRFRKVSKNQNHTLALYGKIKTKQH